MLIVLKSLLAGFSVPLSVLKPFGLPREHLIKKYLIVSTRIRHTGIRYLQGRRRRTVGDPVLWVGAGGGDSSPLFD